MHRPIVRHHRIPLMLLGVVLASACADAAPPPPHVDSAIRSADTSAGPSSAAAPVAAPQTAPVSAPVQDAAHPRTVARTRDTAATRPTTGKPRRLVFGYIDFTGIGYDRGSERAPVVVIDMSDFACPYCGEFSRDVYPSIDREYVQTGKVLFKYIPFIAGSFPHAAEATRAAECVGEQGQFWPMLDHLYATQSEWKRGRAVDAQMAALAGTLPVDAPKFAACYADHHTDARTARMTGIANEIGVRVTPSFLVNGNPVQGALPLAEFRKQIETALLLKASETRPARQRAP